MINITDIAIIGGGVIGLATAYHLKTHPKKSIIVIEKKTPYHLIKLGITQESSIQVLL